MNETHFDVTIIGTGAGGARLAYSLASTGKRILVIERGDFLSWATICAGDFNESYQWQLTAKRCSSKARSRAP